MSVKVNKCVCKIWFWALLQPSTSSQTSMQPVMYLIIASSLWSSWVMIASLPLVQIECTAVGEPHDLRVGGECAPVHGAGPHRHVFTRVWKLRKYVEKIFLHFSNNKAMREITVRPRDFQTWWCRINTASVTFINYLVSINILVQGFEHWVYLAFRFARQGSSKFAREGLLGRGSSQAGSDPLTLEHTKQPMEDTWPVIE